MKKLIIVIILCSIILLTGFSQPMAESVGGNNTLFRFEHKGNYGYMDSKGNVVIKPRYDWTGSFSEGIAAVGILVPSKDDLKWQYHYIGLSGKKVLPGKYDFATSFQEDYAFVGYGDDIGTESQNFKIDPNTFYCIDRDGQYVFICKYYTVTPFSEGLAAVSHSGYKDWGIDWEFINKKGEVVFKTTASSVGSFSDGLVWFDMFDDEHQYRCGFLDKKGKVAIKPIYHGVGDFSEGLAPVQFENEGLWGYIDKKGNVIIRPQFHDAASFSEGIAAVWTYDGWGFIDHTGRFVIKPQYSHVGKCENGLIAIIEQFPETCASSIKYYIDLKGNAIKPKI